MSRQVKTEEKRIDYAFLHHDLVEIRQHVVYASQCRHLHLETNGLGDVADRDMNLV